MATIVISEFMAETAVDRLRETYETIYVPTLVDKPAQLLSAISTARALIVRNRTQVRGELLQAATNLECVGRLGVGLDNIDLAACAARNISVHPATGANDLAVAEYVITSAMVLLRQAYDGKAAMLAGAWPRGALMGQELAGKIMGLVGLGSIAREVAKRALALGMRVLAVDPNVPKGDSAWEGLGYRTLPELLAEADVISLHVPLVDSTRHLINAKALAKVKSTAIIINAARGGVVDDAALAAALKAGALGGAALDVFETEPLTAEAANKFAGIDGLILTPHIAGVTHESNDRVSHLVVDKVLESLG